MMSHTTGSDATDHVDTSPATPHRVDASARTDVAAMMQEAEAAESGVVVSTAAVVPSSPDVRDVSGLTSASNSACLQPAQVDFSSDALPPRYIPQRFATLECEAGEMMKSPAKAATAVEDVRRDEAEETGASDALGTTRVPLLPNPNCTAFGETNPRLQRTVSTESLLPGSNVRCVENEDATLSCKQFTSRETRGEDGSPHERAAESGASAGAGVGTASALTAFNNVIQVVAAAAQRNEKRCSEGQAPTPRTRTSYLPWQLPQAGHHHNPDQPPSPHSSTVDSRDVGRSDDIRSDTTSDPRLSAGVVSTSLERSTSALQNKVASRERRGSEPAISSRSRSVSGGAGVLRQRPGNLSPSGGSVSGSRGRTATPADDEENSEVAVAFRRGEPDGLLQPAGGVANSADVVVTPADMSAAMTALQSYSNNAANANRRVGLQTIVSRVERSDAFDETFGTMASTWNTAMSSTTNTNCGDVDIGIPEESQRLQMAAQLREALIQTLDPNNNNNTQPVNKPTDTKPSAVAAVATASTAPTPTPTLTTATSPINAPAEIPAAASRYAVPTREDYTAKDPSHIPCLSSLGESTTAVATHPLVTPPASSRMKQGGAMLPALSCSSTAMLRSRSPAALVHPSTATSPSTMCSGTEEAELERMREVREPPSGNVSHMLSVSASNALGYDEFASSEVSISQQFFAAVRPPPNLQLAHPSGRSSIEPTVNGLEDSCSTTPVIGASLSRGVPIEHSYEDLLSNSISSLPPPILQSTARGGDDENLRATAAEAVKELNGLEIADDTDDDRTLADVGDADDAPNGTGDQPSISSAPLFAYPSPPPPLQTRTTASLEATTAVFSKRGSRKEDFCRSSGASSSSLGSLQPIFSLAKAMAEPIAGGNASNAVDSTWRPPQHRELPSSSSYPVAATSLAALEATSKEVESSSEIVARPAHRVSSSATHANLTDVAAVQADASRQNSAATAASTRIWSDSVSFGVATPQQRFSGADEVLLNELSGMVLSQQPSQRFSFSSSLPPPHSDNRLVAQLSMDTAHRSNTPNAWSGTSVPSGASSATPSSLPRYRLHSAARIDDDDEDEDASPNATSGSGKTAREVNTLTRQLHKDGSEEKDDDMWSEPAFSTALLPPQQEQQQAEPLSALPITEKHVAFAADAATQFVDPPTSPWTTRECFFDPDYACMEFKQSGDSSSLAQQLDDDHWASLDGEEKEIVLAVPHFRFAHRGANAQASPRVEAFPAVTAPSWSAWSRGTNGSQLRSHGSRQVVATGNKANASSSSPRHLDAEQATAEPTVDVSTQQGDDDNERDAAGEPPPRVFFTKERLASRAALMEARRAKLLGATTTAGGSTVAATLPLSSPVASSTAAAGAADVASQNAPPAKANVSTALPGGLRINLAPPPPLALAPAPAPPPAATISLALPGFAAPVTVEAVQKNNALTAATAAATASDLTINTDDDDDGFGGWVQQDSAPQPQKPAQMAMPSSPVVIPLTKGRCAQLAAALAAGGREDSINTNRSRLPDTVVSAVAADPARVEELLRTVFGADAVPSNSPPQTLSEKSVTRGSSDARGGSAEASKTAILAADGDTNHGIERVLEALSFSSLVRREAPPLTSGSFATIPSLASTTSLGGGGAALVQDDGYVVPWHTHTSAASTAVDNGSFVGEADASLRLTRHLLFPTHANQEDAKSATSVAAATRTVSSLVGSRRLPDAPTATQWTERDVVLAVQQEQRRMAQEREGAMETERLEDVLGTTS